jgi:hypothetical protein
MLEKRGIDCAYRQSKLRSKGVSDFVGFTTVKRLWRYP